MAGPFSGSGSGGSNTGAGFSNVTSMNTQPPPPSAQQPSQQPAQSYGYDPFNVPPPPVQQPSQQPAQHYGNDLFNFPRPPGHIPSVLPGGTSNLGGPGPGSQLPPDLSGLQSTGIFDMTGIHQSDIDDIADDDQLDLLNTPSRKNLPPVAEFQSMVDVTASDLALPDPTNQFPISELESMVEDAASARALLDQLQSRVDAVGGASTSPQRFNELRNVVNPWINAGMNYTGPKQPGLFLPDGTRNPARPARGAGGGGGAPPPTTIPATPGANPTGTGAAAAGGKGPPAPVKAPSNTQAPPPAGTGNISSKDPAKKAPPKATGTKGSTKDAGTKGSTKGPGKKATTKPPGKKGSSNAPTGTTRPPAAGKETKSTGGVTKNSSNRPQSSRPATTSPLSAPPLTATNDNDVVQETPTRPKVPRPDHPAQTAPGTGGVGWQRREDLFEPQVMDAAGIEWFGARETVTALPKLASMIDYNTDNWG